MEEWETVQNPIHLDLRSTPLGIAEHLTMVEEGSMISKEMTMELFNHIVDHQLLLVERPEVEGIDQVAIIDPTMNPTEEVMSRQDLEVAHPVQSPSNHKCSIRIRDRLDQFNTTEYNAAVSSLFGPHGVMSKPHHLNQYIEISENIF